MIFSAPMIKALLAGTKTQTRRIVKPQPSPSSDTAFVGADGIWRFSHPTLRGPVSHEADDVRCRFGVVGDHLWVREGWGIAGDWPHDPGYVAYRAECKGNFDSVGNLIPRWRSPMMMPRRHSRVTLEISDVLVQRLQDITSADAIAEGCAAVSLHDLDCESPDPRHEYRRIWESINGPGSWDANPWVWALTFKRITP